MSLCYAAIALINLLYIKDGVLTDSESRSVASFFEISSPQHLEQMFVKDELENIVINLLDWQVWSVVPYIISERIA